VQSHITMIDMKPSATDIDLIAAAWAAREDRGPLAPQAARERDAWLAADPRHRGAHLRACAVLVRAGRARALGPDFAAAPVRDRPRALAGRTRRWLSLAAAASLVVMALGMRGPSTGPGLIEYQTGLGEVLRVRLRDGSVMTLNSASQASVHYGNERRSVVLHQGEALVDVVKDHDRPFVVRTGSTDVVAVGTSFSVRRNSGDAFVVLVNEGIVDIVQRQPGPDVGPLRIRANHAAVASHESIVRVERMPGDEIRRRLSWREGLISFSGNTLSEAASEFARYSELRILIDDPEVARLRVVGVYSSADPEGFAKAVATSLGLRAERTGEGVRLQAAE
jgi:transmembrane sensor